MANHQPKPFHISSLFLLLMSLSITIPLAHATPDSQPPPLGTIKSTPIGKMFTASVVIDENSIDLARETLPIWLKFAPNSSTVVQGIPQVKDVGRHSILLSDASDAVELEVVEESRNDCGEGTTAWLEVLDGRKLSDVSVEEQYQAMTTLFSTISSSVPELENSLSDIRIFPLNYLNRYRSVSSTLVDDNFSNENGNNGLFSMDQMVILLNISCGELDYDANSVISVVAENSGIFRVIIGRLLQNRPSLETTTTVPITRTTRQIYRPQYHRPDYKPIAVNKLSMFTCKKGVLCQLEISENTFMDAEDGDTRKLTLQVHSIGKEGQRNFLMALPYSTYLEGVPLEVGTFDFRLEARDKANQTASLPFQVKVEDPVSNQKPNHQFSMILDSGIDKFTAKPEVLRDFVYRISQAVHGINIRSYPSQYPQQLQNLALGVKIEDLSENGPEQTMLRWSNMTLSKKVCQQKLINETHKQMVGGKNMERVKIEFRRQMGATFHVRKVTLDLLRTCLIPDILRTFKITATTTEMSVDTNIEPTSSFADALLMPLILLACLLFFIMLLIVLCWMQRKGVSQKKKKKQQGDYVSKGLPVVFPEEVPHEDDDQATVATPMLVNREQPPLDPSRMTMHENPLYKAPPTTQATLVKQLPPTTTTFTSTGPHTANAPSGLGRLGSSSSVAPRSNQGSVAALGQRQPPPYVAAI